MHIRISIMVATLLLSPTGFAGDFTLITVEGIEGAIVPDKTVQGWHDRILQGRGAPHGIQDMLGVEAHGFWTPGVDDVTNFENLLKDIFDISASYHIVEHYFEYRRQYIGLIIDGKKVLYVNSFRKSDDDNYANDLVKVEGGMCWYWYTLFWIDGQESITIHCNGEL